MDYVATRSSVWYLGLSNEYSNQSRDNEFLQTARALMDAGEFDAALDIFITLAKQDDAEANYQLGIIYQKGLGVAPDQKEAEKYFRLAANFGHPAEEEALELHQQQMLSNNVQYGQIRHQFNYDSEESTETLSDSSSSSKVNQPIQENPIDKANALFQREEFKEVHKAYSTLARQGHPEANYRLGLICANGLGVDKDIQQRQLT